MDYMQFVDYHRTSGADITIGCIAYDESRASDFGLMKVSSCLASQGRSCGLCCKSCACMPCSACSYLYCHICFGVSVTVVGCVSTQGSLSRVCVVCVALRCGCVVQIDDARRVTSFAEKPKGPALQDMKVGRDTQGYGLKGEGDQGNRATSVWLGAGASVWAYAQGLAC